MKFQNPKSLIKENDRFRNSLLNEKSDNLGGEMVQLDPELCREKNISRHTLTTFKNFQWKLYLLLSLKMEKISCSSISKLFHRFLNMQNSCVWDWICSLYNFFLLMSISAFLFLYSFNHKSTGFWYKNVLCLLKVVINGRKFINNRKSCVKVNVNIALIRSNLALSKAFAKAYL